MKYSIKPEEHELRQVRNRVEEVTSSYSHAFEAGNVQFYLGWQKLERGASFFYDGGNTLTLVTDLKKNWKTSIEKAVLRGLSHIEFMELSGLDEITFNWQEVLRLGYTEMKLAELINGEIEHKEELGDRWNEIRKHLSNRVDSEEFNEFFYRNTGTLAGMIGQKLLEKHDLEEFPGLKRSDIIEAGDALFE